MAPQRTPTFPNGSDYVDALQNPRTAFTDPDLQAATVKQDQFGFPSPRSGNFASVFKVTSPAGQWAVKCFTRPVAHQQQRYAAIDAALEKLHHPALVHFNYQPHGITVKDDTFPLLKMQWAEAQELLRWLGRHHTDQEKVFHLAGQLVDVIAALEGAGIAHGDLQHGNLLVTDAGKLILVDYDGMYVPALAGYPATEKGLANYQHPARGDADYGPRLDRFSAWAIYTSLYAIAINPRLWNQLRGKDDERLLFASSDYLDPGNSNAFTALYTLGDPQLRKLGEALASYGRMSTLDRIPALDPPEVLGAAPATIPAPRPPLPDTGQLPDWLTDHVQPAAVPAAPAPADPEPELSVQRFPRDRRLTAARITAATGLLGVAGGIWGGRLLPIHPMFWYAVAALAVLLVRWMYKHHPQVLARFKAFRDHQAIKQAIAETERQLSEANKQLATLEQQRLQRQSELDAQRSTATQQRMATETATGNQLRIAVQELTRQLNNLGDGATLRQAALVRVQRDHVQTLLKRAAIDKHPDKIDKVCTGNLAAAGIRTAADFIGFQVRGRGREERTYLRRFPNDPGVYVELVGPKRARSLMDWRERVEQQAQQTAPRTLPPDKIAEIAAQVRQTKHLIERKKEEAHRRRAAAVSAGKSEEQRRRIDIDLQQKQLDAEIASSRDNLRRRAAGASLEVKALEVRAARQEKVVASYAGITGTRFIQAMARGARN